MPAKPPLSIDQLLAVMARVTPKDFSDGILNGVGRAFYVGVAAPLARASLAINRADQQSYILDATGPAPSIGVVTATLGLGLQISLVGGVPMAGNISAVIPGGTIIRVLDRNGNPTARQYKVVQTTTPVAGQTTISFAVQSVQVGYQTEVLVNQAMAFDPISIPAQVWTAITVPVSVPAGVPGFAPGTIGGIYGGTPDGLGALGKSRGIYQQSGESTEAYRARQRSLADIITPVGIAKTINRVLAPFGVMATIREALGSPLPSSGYLIPEDLNTVLHVNGSDLNGGVARKGPSWTKVGTVPFVAADSPIPSVGPFLLGPVAALTGSSAGQGYFELPVVNPLNFQAGQSWCVTVIFSAPDMNIGPVDGTDGFTLISTTSSTDAFGWWITFNEPGMQFAIFNTAASGPNAEDMGSYGDGVGAAVVSGSSGVVWTLPNENVTVEDGGNGGGEFVNFNVGSDPSLFPPPAPYRPNVVSCGYNAATRGMFLKINGAPIAVGSLGADNQPTTTSITTLGGYDPNENGHPLFGAFPLAGQFFEVLASTKVPSDELFTSIYRQIQINRSGKAPPGLLTPLSIGFADSGWFMDNGLGLGANGTVSVGAYGESEVTSRNYFYVYVPWVGGNPGNNFTFADQAPFPSTGYADQQSYTDGSPSLIPTNAAVRALYAALEAAKAAGVRFEIDIGTTPVLAQSGTGTGP